MNEEVEQNHFSRTAQVIYKIDHKAIRLMKWMDFDNYFDNINYFDLLGSILFALKTEKRSFLYINGPIKNINIEMIGVEEEVSDSETINTYSDNLEDESLHSSVDDCFDYSDLSSEEEWTTSDDESDISDDG